MNNRIMLTGAICITFVMSNPVVSVAGVNGPHLPEIGDTQKAGRDIILGDKAFDASNFDEARSDYLAALIVSPFNHRANLGLARCAAAVGDYSEAVDRYHEASQVFGDDIGFLTEALLVMQKAHDVPDAIVYYNRALGLCERGYSADKMETYPANFRVDGSDYDAAEMTAVTHVMRGLNSGDDESAAISSERAAALQSDPTSPIVRYYDSFLEEKYKKALIDQAREKSWRQASPASSSEF